MPPYTPRQYAVFSQSLSYVYYVVHIAIQWGGGGVQKSELIVAEQTRNSSGGEIANINFLYDDIVHAVQIQ